MSKKDIIKIALLVILAFVSSFVIYNNAKTDKKDERNVITEDEIKFKNEYESLNNKKDSKDRDYIEVSIDEDNGMIYASFDQIYEILTEGTGVIYFGYPECPWCRNAAPMLIQAASNKGLNDIYYFNAREIRDTKSLDENGNIVTEKEGTEEYYKLIEVLSDYLGVYEGLNDDNIKRLYFPTVVFVLRGEIVGIHIGTLDSQTDPRVPLTEEQKSKFVNIYMNYIGKVLEDTCDESC